MHIKTLQLKNFRRFEDATFEFGPGFNLLVGENGSGKSSVLEGVFQTLCDFGRVSDDIYQRYIFPLETDVRFESNIIKRKIRIDPIFPCELISNYLYDEQNYDVNMIRMVNDVKGTGMNAISQLWSIVGEKIQKEKIATYPILANFAISRSNKSLKNEIGLGDVLNSKEFRLQSYLQWRIAGLSANALVLWVFSKTIKRLQGGNYVHHPEEPDELVILTKAVTDCVDGCRRIFFDIDSTSLLVEWSDGIIVPFDNLSDGQRIYIAMVADIARRACLLNPHLGENVLKETPGIVLIDELDLHLHPKWQRSIVKNLKQTFPKIQFIATTHSPQIIGECKTDEIIIVTETGGKRPSQSFGMDSNWILECLMETPARDQDIQAKIDEMFKAIDENEFGNARALAAALREKIGPAPEVVKADVLIHRYDGPHLAAGKAAE